MTSKFAFSCTSWTKKVYHTSQQLDNADQIWGTKLNDNLQVETTSDFPVPRWDTKFDGSLWKRRTGLNLRPTLC